MNPFPAGGNGLTRAEIEFPENDPSGMACFVVRSTRCSLPVKTGNVLVDGTLDPIFQWGLVACPSHVKNCGAYDYKINTGLSRVSIYIAKLFKNGQANPPVITLQIRQSTEDGPTNRRITVNFQYGVWENAGGLVVQIEGQLSSQVSVWGRVDPVVGAQALDVIFYAQFDRWMGDKVPILGNGVSIVPDP